MKVVSWIIDAFVDASTPANAVTFRVGYATDDDPRSGETLINSGVTLGESQIQGTIKTEVANVINTIRGSNVVGSADIRLP